MNCTIPSTIHLPNHCTMPSTIHLPNHCRPLFVIQLQNVLCEYETESVQWMWQTVTLLHENNTILVRCVTHSHWHWCLDYCRPSCVWETRVSRVNTTVWPSDQVTTSQLSDLVTTWPPHMPTFGTNQASYGERQVHYHCASWTVTNT